MSEKRTQDAVFADTCVLLNFVQREWEHDRSTALLEAETVDVVVSPNVIEELETVAERRRDIYEDLLDFLLEQETDIEDYDPSDRRVYIGENDAGHVLNLQMSLSNLGDRREILRRLRQFVRVAGRRVEHLRDHLAENTVDPLAPFELELALSSLLNHGADARIVTDAAGWTADGGSGVLVTLDNDDLLKNKDGIVDLLMAEQGPNWVIEIIPPDAVVSEAKQPKQAE